MTGDGEGACGRVHAHKAGSLESICLGWESGRRTAVYLVFSIPPLTEDSEDDVLSATAACRGSFSVL